MKGLQLHITADKREIKDFPKLPSATSFICITLSEISSGFQDVEHEYSIYD